MTNPQSTARIAGHPIHPMLIPFPIAFFVGTFACDVAYWITGNANWAMVTPWLLGAGIIMGALAALAGLTDVIGEQRIRALNDAWLHAGGNDCRPDRNLQLVCALHRGRCGHLAERHYPFAGGCLHPVVRRLDGLEHGLSPSRWDRRRGGRCAVIRDATKGGIIILLDFESLMSALGQ
jgi:Predicted membrane protein (DUF2231)